MASRRTSSPALPPIRKTGAAVTSSISGNICGRSPAMGDLVLKTGRVGKMARYGQGAVRQDRAGTSTFERKQAFLKRGEKLERPRRRPCRQHGVLAADLIGE